MTLLSLEVARNLRQLAQSLEALAETIHSNESAPATKETDPITIEMVRAVLAEKSQSGKQPEVKALITKFGAIKLTDVNPEKYEELLAEAQVL